MRFHTRLTERLAIEHPILLAPMNAFSGGALAGAVSQAGGLGLVAAGWQDNADWLERELAAAGNARVGCGFITWWLDRHPQLLDAALARRPAAVMLSFGDPTPYAPAILASGAALICQVQTVAQARQAADLGADIIVAQGTEAGGHGGGRTTFTLVPAVVDALAGRGIAVAAAGGIADGRGLAAALALGADGVLMGTRFYASDESLAAPEAKARVVAAAGEATVRTRIFDIIRRIDWPPHITGRALANDFARRWHGREDALEQALADQLPSYAEAVSARDFETAVIFASEAVDLIHAVKPAAAIVADIVVEAQAVLARVSGRVG
jgi:nitronate monooxygenase